MGRSRGGSTTKIHAVVDSNGLPITLKLTAGQAHDGRRADDMLATVAAGQTLLADRGYDSNALRQRLAERGAFANVKPMPGRKMALPFSSYLYRFSNQIERFFNKIKPNRAIATRYEKYDANYLALVKLASTRLWLRVYESVAQSPSPAFVESWLQSLRTPLLRSIIGTTCTA